MFGILLAAASALQSAAHVGSDIMAGLSGHDPKDAARIQAANSALQKALAGDTSQILYMQQQAGQIPGFGSATAVGKEAFRRVLVAYDQAKGTHYNLGASTAPLQPAPSPAQAVLSQTQAAVQQDLATGAQQLLTGGVNQITHAISPNAGTSVPLTQNQTTLLYAGGAAVVAFLALKLLKKGHA